jgi:hypothetical protein
MYIFIYADNMISYKYRYTTNNLGDYHGQVI